MVDLTDTYTSPSDVEKGNRVKLYVNGLVTDDVVITDLELDVYWDDALL